MRVDLDPRVPIISNDINLDPRGLVLVGVLRVRLFSSFDVGRSCIFCVFKKGLSNCNYGKWRGQHFLPHSDEIGSIYRRWGQEGSVWSRQKLRVKKETFNSFGWLARGGCTCLVRSKSRLTASSKGRRPDM